jgi:hypothetical protein
MKTTLEIADGLFAEMKAASERDKTTLRALFERGARLALLEREQNAKPYVMPDCSVGTPGAPNGGLTDETVAAGGYAALRELAYEDRLQKAQ